MNPIYVTVGDWRVSTMTGSGITGALLDVYTFPEAGSNRIEYAVKQKPFASCDEARDWAFANGYLKIYEPKN